MRRWALFLAVVLFVELLVLYPGVFFRGDVLTSSALAYGLPPWKGHLPAGGTLRWNPVLSDDLFMFTPWDEEIRAGTVHGDAPLWNPLSGCGMPLLANNQSAVLAPSQVLRWFWNSPRARTFGLLAKLFIAAFGMFLLLRRWGVTGAGAALGGLAWANSAAMTVWLFYPLSETAAWLSWVILGVSQVLGVGGPPRRFGRITLALSLAAMLLSGHLPTAVQLLFAVGAGTVGWALFVPAVRPRLLRLAAPALLGLLLASPQILTTARYILDSHARDARSQSPPAATHLPPRALWSWLVPRGFGSPERLGYFGPLNFNEATASVGLVALALALAGAVLSRRRASRALAALVFASCLLAYGAPPLAWLLERMPVLRWCGGQRWIVLAQWGAAALAGIGLDALRYMAPRRLVLIAVTLLAALGAAASLHPCLGATPLELEGETARTVLAAEAELLLACGAIILARTRAASIVFPALIAASGLLLAWQFNPAIPASAIPGENEDVAAIRRLAAGGRVFALGWCLVPNTGALGGIRTVNGYDDLLPERYFRLASILVPPQPASSIVSLPVQLLGRCATTLVVSDRPIAAPGTSAVSDFGASHFFAASLADSHPLLAWYPNVIRVRDEAGAVDRLRSPVPVPASTILIVGAPGATETGTERVALRFIRESAQKICASCNQSRPGWVVLREMADSGWKVRVDGVSLAWTVADGLFPCVAVESGAHRIEFAYEPREWILGLILAGIGLVLLVLTAAQSAKSADRSAG